MIMGLMGMMMMMMAGRGIAHGPGPLMIIADGETMGNGGGVGGDRAKGSQLIIILPFFFLFNQPAEAPADKLKFGLCR